MPDVEPGMYKGSGNDPYIYNILPDGKVIASRDGFQTTVTMPAGSPGYKAVAEKLASNDIIPVEEGPEPEGAELEEFVAGTSVPPRPDPEFKDPGDEVKTEEAEGPEFVYPAKIDTAQADPVPSASIGGGISNDLEVAGDMLEDIKSPSQTDEDRDKESVRLTEMLKKGAKEYEESEKSERLGGEAKSRREKMLEDLRSDGTTFRNILEGAAERAMNFGSAAAEGAGEVGSAALKALGTEYNADDEADERDAKSKELNKALKSGAKEAEGRRERGDKANLKGDRPSASEKLKGAYDGIMAKFSGVLGDDEEEEEDKD